MIIFYKKDTGKIFATVDGRVHSEQSLNCKISDGTPDENIGKYIIGWIEKNGQKIEYNMDQFPLLQEFESVSKESPLDYIVDIETGKLVRQDSVNMLK